MRDEKGYAGKPDVGNFIDNLKGLCEDFFSHSPIERLNELVEYLGDPDDQMLARIRVFISPLGTLSDEHKAVANSNLARYLCSYDTLCSIRELLYVKLVEALICTDNT